MPRIWPALDIAIPDDLVQAALADFDVAIHEQSPDRWRVFFQSHEARDRATMALRHEFPKLSLEILDVPDEDWAARSQAGVAAVRIGGIIVAPPWDVAGDTITIVIQPSMGFGTGHHATTRLCLAHLQQLDLRGRTVLDAGTGSGVLAIAASRLGALNVLAIDYDEDAIESARENVALNPGADVTLGAIDLRRAALRPFDLVLANLTGGLLIAAADNLQRLAARGGRLILSGFVDHEARDVSTAFESCTIERQSQEEEWVCVTLLRGSSHSNLSGVPAV